MKQALIKRRFRDSGDIDEASTCVHNSSGVQRTKDLALAYAEHAIEAVMQLKPSTERDALANLALRVVFRTR